MAPKKAATTAKSAPASKPKANTKAKLTKPAPPTKAKESAKVKAKAPAAKANGTAKALPKGRGRPKNQHVAEIDGEVETKAATKTKATGKIAAIFTT